MEKLTIEHLAPYSPYAVKMYHLEYKKYWVDLCPANVKWFTESTHFAKIVLRPLSDLTKEIEVNGEKFVPLEKLAKIEFKAERRKFVFKEIKTGGAFPWGNKIRIKIEFGENLGTVEFGYTQSTHFFYFENYTHKSGFSPCIHNKEMLVKLYEWHFDLHDLIKNNLAIDINTLK